MSFVLSPDMYPFRVLVSIGENAEQLKKSAKKRCNIDIDSSFTESGVKGMALDFEKGRLVLWLQHFPKDPFSLSVLSHEIFHITTFAMNHIGIILTKDSDEAFAYMISWLTEEILKRTTAA